MNATLSNCNFQIKFGEQNLKSARPCALILIFLPPVTGLRIARVITKLSINKYSLCVLGIKRRKVFLHVLLHHTNHEKNSTGLYTVKKVCTASEA